ncbi:MAG: hypothetical protein D3917_14835 [Candidatus Electrothrix sp. AX5]|nr:hypothetical protein [Candidatus Electrothrix sp. AX5]
MFIFFPQLYCWSCLEQKKILYITMKALYLVEFKKYLPFLVYPQSTEQQLWEILEAFLLDLLFAKGDVGDKGDIEMFFYHLGF